MNPNVARLVARFHGFNALNVPTVNIYIQRYPGRPTQQNGIADLEYEVRINNVLKQTGRTDNCGKVVVQIPAGTTPVLKVMGTDYEISSSNLRFGNVNTSVGKKERLRHLGYQIGHDGADGNGVDNVDNRYEYERSILDYQADKGLDQDAKASSIEDDLKKDAGE